MKIELHWTCSYQEYRHLNQAHAAALAVIPVQHNNSLIASPQVERRFLLFGVGIVSIVAYAGVVHWTGNSLLTLVLGIPILTPLVWIWWSPGTRTRFHDSWLNNPSYRDSITFVITDSTVIRTSTHCQITFEWQAFNFVYEDANFFLLFRGSQLSLAVPKAAFKSQDDLHNFRERGRAAMPPPVRGFPIEPS